MMLLAVLLLFILVLSSETGRAILGALLMLALGVVGVLLVLGWLAQVRDVRGARSDACLTRLAAAATAEEYTVQRDSAVCRNVLD